MRSTIATVVAVALLGAPAAAHARHPRIPIDTQASIGVTIITAIPTTIEYADVDVDCRQWWRRHICRITIETNVAPLCRFTVRARARRWDDWRIRYPAPCWDAILNYDTDTDPIDTGGQP